MLEDAPNVEQQIQDSIAAVIALELDRVALYGSGVAPQPTGLKLASGIGSTVLGGGNGSTPTNFDFLADAIFGVRTDNFEPTGAIDNPRTEQTLSKLKDTTNQPLQAPADVARLPRYSTNQVPVNITEGTSTNCSDVFVGAWRELLIGMRHQLSIEFLRERYLADSLTVAFLAWIRADIAVARPAAFELVRGIRP